MCQTHKWSLPLRRLKIWGEYGYVICSISGHIESIIRFNLIFSVIRALSVWFFGQCSLIFSPPKPLEITPYVILCLVSRIHLNTFNQLGEQLKTSNKSLYIGWKSSPLPSQPLIMAHLELSICYPSLAQESKLSSLLHVYFLFLLPHLFSSLPTLLPSKWVVLFGTSLMLFSPCPCPIWSWESQEQTVILRVCAKDCQHCWLAGFSPCSQEVSLGEPLVLSKTVKSESAVVCGKHFDLNLILFVGIFFRISSFFEAVF